MNDNTILPKSGSGRRPPPAGGDVVLYASDGTRAGNYQVVSDANGRGWSRVCTTLMLERRSSVMRSANPGTFVEMQFTAQAGVALPVMDSRQSAE